MDHMNYWRAMFFFLFFFFFKLIVRKLLKKKLLQKKYEVQSNHSNTYLNVPGQKLKVVLTKWHLGIQKKLHEIFHVVTQVLFVAQVTSLTTKQNIKS